jgi:hypothetical protein
MGACLVRSWSSDELGKLAASGEMEIAVERHWLPIWVVCVGEHVYVRTWYRRDTGWFGGALRARRARIRVPGLETGVTIEDVGARADGVDAAYLAKYGRAGAESMITPAATDTTLRLSPE